MDEIKRWEREEKEKTQAPGLFSERGVWIRHSRYEIIKDDENPQYSSILPSKDAQINYYKPFDYYPEILKDFLSLGRYLEESGNPAPDNRDKYWEGVSINILRFYKKYGFLDLEDDYNVNFPDRYEGDFLLDVTNEIVEFFKMADKWNSFIEGNYKPEDIIEYYSDYKQGNGKPPKFTTSWADYIEDEIYANDLGLGITFSGTWQLVWGFNSLLGALKIMFLLNITTEKQPVKMCMFCRRPYIARKKDQKFCDASCGNVVRQRKFQKKERIKSVKKKTQKN